MKIPLVGEGIPSSLGEVLVQDQHGEERRLASTWEGHATLLVFLRHFGCIGCNENLASIQPRLEELTALGVRVALVGNGAAHYIEPFVQRHGLSIERMDVLTDPSLRVYREAGLKRSLWGTFGLPGIRDFLKGFSKGHFQNRVEGDVQQQGGAILLDSGGIVHLYHRSLSLGDHASMHDVIDAALRITAQQVPASVFI